MAWYNQDHQHSGIRYVIPNQRHQGQDALILKRENNCISERVNSSHEMVEYDQKPGCHTAVELNPDVKTLVA